MSPAVQHGSVGAGPSTDPRQFNPAVSGLPSRVAQNQHAQNYPTPDAYTPYPWSNSPPTSSIAQFPVDVPAEMMPGPSSLAHHGSVVSMHSEESFQLPSSSGLRDDLDGNATSPSRYASSGTPSLANPTLPQQGTTSAVPKPLGKKRRPGQRKRDPDPRDPKAAERLRNQRRTDDEHIEDILNLLVPDGERDVPKKDRLRLSTSQSLCPSS